MMNKQAVNKSDVIYFFIIAILAFITLSTVSPSAQPLPGRDQGVFLFIGKGILQGGIPYKDFWDHKGPLIYYINALGLLLVGKSYWGVWLLEVLSLAVSLALSFMILQKAFGRVAAFWGTMVWLAGLGSVMNGGNMVEEFALPLQFAQIYLFLYAPSKGIRFGKYLLIGFIAGLAFLLRPNIIGIFLSIFILTILEFWSEPKPGVLVIVSKLGLMLAGFAAVLSIVCIYLVTRQAFGQFLDSVFTYNFLYSSLRRNMLGEFTFGLNQLPVLSVFGIAGWAVCVAIILFQKGNGNDARFARLAAIGLPVEILLSLTAGRNYAHYFISWLPMMGLLAGYFASHLLQGVASSQASFGLLSSQLWLYGLLAGICFLPIVGGLPDSRLLVADIAKHKGLPDPNFNRSDSVRLIKYLQQMSPSYEYFQFWGNEMEYNFILDRQPPSRFGYMTPLLTPPYASFAIAEEFLKGLQEHQSMIVVDSGDTSSTIDFPLFESNDGWNKIPTMNSVIQYLRQNYKMIDQIGPYQIWVPENR